MTSPPTPKLPLSEDVTRWMLGRLHQLQCRWSGHPVSPVQRLTKNGRIAVTAIVVFLTALVMPHTDAGPAGAAGAGDLSSTAAPTDAASQMRKAYVDSLSESSQELGMGPLHFGLADGATNVLEITGFGTDSKLASGVFRGYIRKTFPLDSVRMRQLGFASARIHFSDGMVAEWAFSPKTKRARIIPRASGESQAVDEQAADNSSTSSDDETGEPGKALKGSQIVWASQEALKKGAALLGNGVRDPDLLAPYVACLTHAGDRGAITDGGFFSQTITIVAGRDRGCEGVVGVSAWVSSQSQ